MVTGIAWDEEPCGRIIYHLSSIIKGVGESRHSVLWRVFDFEGYVLIVLFVGEQPQRLRGEISRFSIQYMHGGLDILDPAVNIVFNVYTRWKVPVLYQIHRTKSTNR